MPLPTRVCGCRSKDVRVYNIRMNIICTHRVVRTVFIYLKRSIWIQAIHFISSTESRLLFIYRRISRRYIHVYTLHTDRCIYMEFIFSSLPSSSSSTAAVTARQESLWKRVSSCVKTWPTGKYWSNKNKNKHGNAFNRTEKQSGFLSLL